jgi:hypothetical protein
MAHQNANQDSHGPFIPPNMVDDDFPVAALTPSQIFDALGTTVPTTRNASLSRIRTGAPDAVEETAFAPESEHTGATTSLESAPVVPEDSLGGNRRR